MKDSVEHEIVVPYRVNNEGRYLSHNLLHHRTKRNLGTQQIHYQIPLKNEIFHLTLTPNEEFLASHLKVEWRSGRTTLPMRNCHFIGSLRNHTGSSVAISNCEGLVSTNYSQLFLIGCFYYYFAYCAKVVCLLGRPDSNQQ